MTKRKKIIIASIVSVLTLGGFAVAAGGGSHCGFGMHGADLEKRGAFMVKRMTHKLDLNEPQVANLKAMQQFFIGHHKENKAKQGGELLSLLDAPSLDQAQALSLLVRRGEEKRAKAPEIIAAVAAFTDSLTPEQRTKLKDTLKSFSQRGGFGKPFSH